MTKKLSANEGMKTKSRGLRGSLLQGMANQITGAITDEEQQLIKFHGSYQQDDRDRRAERERKKLEWAYSYMIRLRIPGGDITADQWLRLQESCDRHASGIIKITTRQTIQFHGVVKVKTKPAMKDFEAMGLDSIAACGDVNRNVMCGANPALANYHSEVFQFAEDLSLHLLPKTGAFREIWLDGEKLSDGSSTEEDLLYQDHYLPRKFKIGIAIPPHNESDVFANDVGLIAIGEGDNFIGFNVSIGGGLGATHGNNATYPRRGTIIGFVPKEKTLEAVWQIVAIQRDHGNREDRKLARLKYTLDRLGVDWFKEELASRCGFDLEDSRPYEFKFRGDTLGWVKDVHGNWCYGIFIESGLVSDIAQYHIKTALIELAQTKKCAFRFTGNQNIMLTHVKSKDKLSLEAILTRHGIIHEQYSPSRKEAIACVALPTCPLALAEGQRYLPSLISEIEQLQEKHGIKHIPISIRMTGCPNGCGRPYLAEIGFIGKSAGKYVLRLGGDYQGERLNQVYKEEVDEKEILSTLDELFGKFVNKRLEDERFGDYVHRIHFKGDVFQGVNNV
jgi:sulfite reductase (NADPH) hemoprotein beta-component